MQASRSPGVLARLCTFARHEGGATAIEYGLICALIALVIIVAMSAVFAGIAINFNLIDNAL